MANSNYNVNLSFTADVSAAKALLNQLQTSLTDLSKSAIMSPTTKWTPEIQEAALAALLLKHHLESATNVKTGTLDFSRLNDSVKKSGMSLTEYGRKLLSLGPQGQLAFMQLAGAVAQSEVPIKRVNKVLADMAVTMKNTAKWQLSSSVLHGFMGAVLSAYGYAQDLNRSLNDIRIVTGLNIEQMSRFAELANKAARALSTTTTDYTNASLIYYQLGLSDTEVKERTDITIKMANAAGQSAEIVSDQMTAVWNNFDDGSKSLEYYADVMTALGAATASSTDEIAAGLEKFSAIAGTVGLSYEYATSALATVTAETRQSAEVVGTAFKTLFARIEGLKLGETLEDGTDLNKYSEALAKVGVDIKDASGEMRSMDNILSDLGTRWQTLAKDELIALAQTVAGVRLYNQLISLMDNWDTFLENLGTAYGSSGTLEELAEIYAESWEAAQDRVKAAAEDIYDSLIDEDFFIGMLKGVEKLLGGVGNLVDSLGGVKGVLSSIAMIATRVFAGQMAEGVRNFAFNLKASTIGGRQLIEDQKILTLTEMGDMMASGANKEGSRVGKIAANLYRELLDLLRLLAENSKNMTESEIQGAKQLLDIRSLITLEYIKAATETEKAKEKVSDNYMRGMSQMYAKAETEKDPKKIKDMTSDNYHKQIQVLKENELAFNSLKLAVEGYRNSLDAEGNETKESAQYLTMMADALEVTGMGLKEATYQALDLAKALKEQNLSYEDILKVLSAYGSGLLENSALAQVKLREMGLTDELIDQIILDYINLGNAENHEKSIKEDSINAQLRINLEMSKHKAVIKDYADGIVAGAQALTSFTSVCSAASGMINALTNPDLSGWERFTQVLSSLGSIIMSSVFMMSSLSLMTELLNKKKLKESVINMANLLSETLLAKAKDNTAKAADRQEKEIREAGKEKDKDTVRNITNKASEDANNKSKDNSIKTNKTLGGSFKELGKSAGQYIKSLGPMIAKGGAAAAAVAIVALAVSAAILEYNKQEKAAEEAALAAEKVAQHYESVKSAQEEFSNSAKNYTSIIDSMKEMTKGTLEYNEAMILANAEATKLILAYKGLADDYKIENGLIVIDPDALELALNEELRKVGKALAMSVLASSTTSRAESEHNKTQWAREELKSNTDVSPILINAAAMAAAGAVAGTIMPGIGNLAGAIVGGVAGAITGAVSTLAVGSESSQEQEAIDRIIELYQDPKNKGMFASSEELRKVLEKNNVASGDLLDLLVDNCSAIRELTEVESLRLQLEKADWELAYANANMGNTTFTESLGLSYMTEESYAYKQENYDRVAEEVSSLFDGSNNDFWSEYLREVYGETVVSDNTTNVSGENYRIKDMGGGNATILKKTAEGTWETIGEANSLSEEASEQQLINAKLLNEATQETGEFARDYEKLAGLLAKAGGMSLSDDEDVAKINEILSAYQNDTTVDFSKYGYHFAKNFDLDKITDTKLLQKIRTDLNEYLKEATNIAAIYDNLTSDEKELLGSITIDKDATEDEVRQALIEALKVADANAIKGSIEFGSKLEEFILSNPTAEDWTKEGGGKELFDEWLDNSNILTSDDPEKERAELWRNFMTMTTDELLLYLEDAQAAAAARNYSNANNTLTDKDTTVAESLAYLDNNYNTIRFNSALDSVDRLERLLIGLDTYKFDPTQDDGSYVPQRPINVPVANSTLGITAEQLLADQIINYASELDTRTSDEIAEAELNFDLWQLDETLRLTNAMTEAMLSGDNEAYYAAAGELEWVESQEAPLMGGEAGRIQEYMKYYTLGNADIMNSMATVDSLEGNDVLTDLNKILLDENGNIKAADTLTAEQTDQIILIIREYGLGLAEEYKTEKENLNDTYVTPYLDAQETVENEGVSDTDLAELQIALAGLEKYLEQYDATIELFKTLRGELAESYSVDDYLEELGKTLATASQDEVNEYNTLLDLMAKSHIRVNSGLTKLVDNWDKWNGVLGDSNSTAVEIAEIMPDVKNALSDILDADTTLLPFITDDFVQENWKNIRDVLNGVSGALEDLLGKLAAEKLEATVVLDENAPEAMTSALSGVMDMLLNNMPDMEVGMTLDDSGMYTALLALLDSGAITADLMNDLLSNIGFEPTIEEQTIDFDAKNATKTETGYDYTYTDPLTNEERVAHITLDDYAAADATGKITIPTINAKKTVYKNAGASIAPPKKTGGGGGGGGSKSKPAKKVDKTKKTDVVERYKEINDLLDDMANALDKTSGKADRLYGKARIKAMRELANLMRQEIDLLKRKLTEALKNLKIDEKALLAASREAKVNIKIGEDGNISNYTTEMTKLYDELAAAEAKMDKMSTQEELNEFKEKVIDEDILRRIDLLKDAIALYDETRELLEDIDKEITEKEWGLEDLEFETFTYEIELKIEIDDRELQYLEYLLGNIEDKAFAAAERIGNLTEQADLLLSKAETSRGALDKILADNLTKNDKKLFDTLDPEKINQIDWQSYIDNETFTEAEVEELKKHADSLLDYNNELFAMQDLVHEELLNSFAEWNEEIEKGIALFDHYDSVVDHLLNITDLTQGLTGYNAELNRTLAQTRTLLANDRAASYKTVYDDQKAAAENMRAKMYAIEENGKTWLENLSESELEKWLEDLEVAEEAVREAEENLFASVSEAISSAINEFEVAFTSSLKEMELALNDKGGLAAWNESLERQQEMSERTLKVYQETYELSKLNRQVINSIDETDNVKAKLALLEILEEIYQYQKDGKEMSQYELDYLQKKYELRLAEIALEEALNAKSQVRMSRDAEGNWGYVYTADEDKIAEAEQNYEDKLYEITNLTEEYLNQISASIIQTYQEFNDAMQEIYDRNAEGLYASEGEFLAAIDETRAYYEGKLQYQYDLLDIATANNKALYEDDWTAYEFSTGAKINSNKSFLTSFNATMVGMATGYQNSQGALNTFKVNAEALTGKIAAAHATMTTQVNTNLGLIDSALGTTGTNLGNLSGKFTTYLSGDGKDSIKKKSQAAREQIVKDSNLVKEILMGKDGKGGGLIDSVGLFSEKWRDHILSIIDKNEALIKSINALNKALVEGEKKDDDKPPKDPPKNDPPKNDPPKNDKPKLAIGSSVKVKSGTKWYYDSYGTAPTGTARNGTIKYMNLKGSHPYNLDGLGWIRKTDIVGYDTGGYTGKWGKEGKLAFLHQKELILNQDDTKNFLLAMNVLREITKAITLQSVIPDASKFNFGGKNVVEQDVTIHAEFPNVTDHNEIEMALSNLVNTASQYANRK